MKSVQALSLALAMTLAAGGLSFAQRTAASPASTTAGAPLPAGDAARGKSVFEGKGNCLSCHAVNGPGSHFGPDLSFIGNPPLGRGGRGGAGGNTAVPPPPVPVNTDQLRQSIVDPNASVSNTNRYVLLAMKDGSTSGKLLNQDTFAIQILDFKERLQSLSRSNIRNVEFKSPMPSYQDKFTPQELADVISYPLTLKGQAN